MYRHMTTPKMDAIHAYTVEQADTFLRRDGFIAPAIHAIDRAGQQVLSVIAGPSDAEVEIRPDESILIVPMPFQQHKQLLADAFRQFDVVGATWMSEVWMYPPDEAHEALNAHMTGGGPPPSGHPRRREAVVICTLWPLGAYVHVAVRRIVRGGGSPYLRDWPADPAQGSFRQSADDPAPNTDALPSMVITWLEECLPARGE